MREGQKKERVDFLAGKGFYVVLFACIAVIGVSAWILLFTGGEGREIVQEVGGYGSEGREEEAEVMNTEYPEGEDVFSRIGASEVTPPSVKQERKESPSTEEPSTETPKAETPKAETPKAETAKAEETKTEEKKEEGSEKREESGTSEKRKTIEEMTFVWPVAGKIETPFSVEMPVYNRTLAVWRIHTGIDIASSIGTKVLAITDGEVEEVYEDDMMGTTVVIDHGEKLKSIYSNLAATPVVKEGDKIAMGAVVGAVGNTALGEIGQVSHLHLEMTLDGDVINPEDYLPTR